MTKQPIVVIKLGTSSIVDEKTHQPLISTLSVIVETAVLLRQNGYRVVIVSSGAIGLSLWKMNLPRRPKHLPQVQALASIGQCRLIGIWEKLFEQLNQPIAQILLTRNDIADRTQYLNAQNTFGELLHMGVIPIVNENDTLSVTEIKFGDNDTLSAITAGMIQADYLFLMTDVDCLYDKNPRTHPDAKAIEVVENIADLTADVSSAGSVLGTGGMSTKIVAARLATAAGITTVITRSSKPGQIAGIVEYLEAQKTLKRASITSRDVHTTLNSTSIDTVGPVQVAAAPLHTRFMPSAHPIRDRYFWLLHGLAPHGTVFVDAGAARALQSNAGLLPVGVVDAIGSFAQQECVRIVEVDTAHRRTNSNSTSTPQSPSTGQHHHHVAIPERERRPPHNRSVSVQDLVAASNPPVDLKVDLTASLPSLPPVSSTGTPVRPSLSNTASATNLTEAARQSGREIGRAIVNYSCIEIRRIAGLKSTDIAGVLGYADSEYVALRENIALLDRGLAQLQPHPSSSNSQAQDKLARSEPGTPPASTSSGHGTPVTMGRQSLGLGGYVEG